MLGLGEVNVAASRLLMALRATKVLVRSGGFSTVQAGFQPALEFGHSRRSVNRDVGRASACGGLQPAEGFSLTFRGFVKQPGGSAEAQTILCISNTAA
jgi:hypothetical protein